MGKTMGLSACQEMLVSIQENYESANLKEK